MESIGKNFEMLAPQKAGERVYETGDKVRALDENKQQIVEWTVVSYEKVNKILHLERELPSGDIRMRVVHVDRIIEEQKPAQAPRHAAA